MIYILSGQDDFSIAQALDTIKKELGDAETLAMSTTTLEGQQLTAEELKTVCETIPFMMGKRLVIVDGLLGRFETGGRSRRQTKTPRKSKKQDEAGAFIDCLSGGVPETTVLVMTEGVITESNPLFTALSKKATVKSYSLPRDRKLGEWIQKRVKEEGGTISTKAVQLLTRMVGSNLWVMANEVNKLVLYADARTIEEEDVKAVVGVSHQATVFNLTDAILEFRAEQAERMLQQQFLAGVAPVYLLYMLSRQVNQIVRAKELVRYRKNNREIQGTLGMRGEWQLKKTLEQANRYSLPRLKEVYQNLLETDISIKTGKLDAELALNVLVAELCRRGGGQPSRTGMRT